MEYSYPISIDWTTEEIIEVVEFFQLIEQAFEDGIERKKLMDQYRKFKKVVPSIGEEKRIFKEFEKVSGLSSYRVVKQMKEMEDGTLIKL